MVKQVGIPLEIDRGTGQCAPNVNHLLGELRGEREMQADSNRPCECLDAPPAIEFLIPLQHHTVRCLDCGDFKWANQVENGSEAVRPYFQNDVPRIPEHSERDRHMIGPTYLAGLQIIIDMFTCLYT